MAWWVMALGLCAGCATAPPVARSVPQALFADASFPPPAQPVDASAVLALSPAMQRYLDVELEPLLRRHGRVDGLVEALYSKANLRLDYDSEVTRTAAEAFDARAGNCLSLAVMTAALAKHLNLPVEYQVVVGQESWSREAGLTIANGHLNITVSKRLVDRVPGYDGGGAWRLDFGGLTAGRGAALRTVDEARVLAMFMSNRAAESLVRGDMAQAYAYAHESLMQDPGYASAYNTLGVIYRRHGLADLAERAWQQALAIDDRHAPALANLAQAYESSGRAALAAPLRGQLARLDAEPPFAEFDLGRAALARGDAAAARRHFERALKREPDYHEFHHQLAVALAMLGDADGAERHLEIARRNSPTRRDQALYAGKLIHLKSLADQPH
jgi:Tfp pilus assembly protein PilF